jgi:integrase
MVSDLTSETIEDFYQWYRRRKKKKGPAAKKCAHAIREVRAMLLWGDQHEVCLNPVRRWPQANGAPPPTRHFSDDDFAKLLKAIPTDFADLLVFGALVGLRPQELRALRSANLIGDRGRTFVHIERHKTSESSKVSVPRTVPLSAEAAAIADRQLAAHPQSGFVFVNDDGSPYSAGGLRQRLKRWCKRAGVPVMPPYALRHVFGTRQARNGTNQAILAQIMGHSNLQTTARYVVNCDDAHIDAVDSMSSSLMAAIRKAGDGQEPVAAPALQPMHYGSTQEVTTAKETGQTSACTGAKHCPVAAEKRRKVATKVATEDSGRMMADDGKAITR